jgi:hypothetical protein
MGASHHDVGESTINPEKKVSLPSPNGRDTMWLARNIACANRDLREMAKSYALDIPPDWDAIDRVREEVIRFLRDRSEDGSVIDAIAMVVSELTENAIKYGKFAASDRVAVSVDASDHAITVEVRNPTSSEDMVQLARLDRTIQWIRGYQDPFQAYLARLQEVSMQNVESGESGLGLVRVAYEGESSLDFYLGEGGTLAVSAVYQK